ncbi:hypothetical protein AWC38_SpisGene22166 [Stylophora pistillata]|uniref:Uncharacterized protein n=1 Tax=Stylophora pistillata TaxID=50429 RepID=A0A2B4R5U9_STYPI|nr:hypothetical protein AWC38_SpisGene22166 [Stylophora pistillata]
MEKSCLVVYYTLLVLSGTIHLKNVARLTDESQASKTVRVKQSPTTTSTNHSEQHSGVDDFYYDTVKPKITRKGFCPMPQNSVSGKEGGSEGLQSAKENSEYAMLDVGRMEAEETTLTRPEHSAPATPGGSFYLPPSGDSSTAEEIFFDSAPATTKRETKSKITDPLNNYLRTRDISPIRSRLQRPWEEASARIRRYHLRKAGQGPSTLLQDIAPSDSGSVFKEVYSFGVIQRALQCNGEEATSSSVDETMMSALAECYRTAKSWETRWQILSTMADKNQLRHWLPDLS